MKKVFILSMVCALFVSLAACDAKGQQPEAGSPVSENPESSQPNEAETRAEQEDETEAPQENKDQNKVASDDAEIQTDDPDMPTRVADMKMNVQIGDASFTAVMEDNAATRELVEMMKQGPVSIEMSDYSGFEKVGSLGRSLTTDNHQTTTSAGDIVLYSGDQIVMFYGSNSWSYTRIGKIDDLSGWEEALGSGSITAVFTIAE